MTVGGAAVSFCGEEFPAYSWKVWDEKESTFECAASVTLPCVPRSWGCARMGGWCCLEIPVVMDGEEVGASGLGFFCGNVFLTVFGLHSAYYFVIFLFFCQAT